MSDPTQGNFPAEESTPKQSEQPEGRWNPFGIRWYVVVNDLIGGWAVSHIDKPLSAQDFQHGEGDIFDSLTKELAEYIVVLHHAHLHAHPDALNHKGE